ncbi:hypothetical protein BDV93DRAFT_163892 [Ceratobasidium sp. AG-I]|nr:hypothetical protein BDV93DRAFT_163892 [Ceratobasidium sp. AG-I]
MTCRRPAGCGHQFCWLCLADYIPIMTEGNHRHASSCRHYAPITGPASRLHAVLAPQTPPAPPILPNIIRVPTPPIYSVLTQARAFRVLARRTPTPHPYGVDVAPRPAPTVQPTIPAPTPALAPPPVLAPAPARAHPVWGWIMGAISSAL